MDESCGYIKLWRKTMDSAVFQTPELFKLWVMCLMKATHKERWIKIDGINEPVKVFPGQFITGRYALHSDFYSRQTRASNRKSPLTVWRWLEVLQNMQNLNIKTNNKYSIVTIINWERYQVVETENEQVNEQVMNNRRTTDEQQMNTNKNDKEDTIRPKPDEDQTGEVQKPPKQFIPYQEILNLYHATLPELPQVRILSDSRKAQIRQRWTSGFTLEKSGIKINTIEFWERFFKYVSKSDFLMGRVEQNGKPPFRADLEWLTKQANFIKVMEAKYH